MKVIFMGTPDFAVGTLEAIIEAGHEVVLVVTQPDKPRGRSGALQFTPVKECAVAHGIEVFQPTKIRLEENVEYLLQNGKIVFIDRPLKYLITTSDRPLSRNEDLLKKRYTERYPIYKETADIHFVPIKDKECNAKKIIKEWKNEIFGN